MLVHNSLRDLVFSCECFNAPTILELRSTPMAGDIVKRPWRSVYEALELFFALFHRLRLIFTSAVNFKIPSPNDSYLNLLDY